MPRPAVKRGGHGAARVARGRDENRERALVAVRERQRALHELGQEARADVLERGRRPMKQLEHRELAVRVDQLPQRHREVERSPADRAHLALEPGAREERREQIGGDVRERLALEVAGAEARQLLGHVQAAVGGEPAHHRVDEADGFSATGAQVSHRGTVRGPAQPRWPPTMLQRRSRSAKMPAAVTAGPAPGPRTISGLSQ